MAHTSAIFLYQWAALLSVFALHLANPPFAWKLCSTVVLVIFSGYIGICCFPLVSFELEPRFVSALRSSRTQFSRLLWVSSMWSLSWAYLVCLSFGLLSCPRWGFFVCALFAREDVRKSADMLMVTKGLGWDCSQRGQLSSVGFTDAVVTGISREPG